MFKKLLYAGQRFKNTLVWKRKIPVSQWARKYHNLPETAAIPGKWGEHMEVPFADMFLDWYNKRNLQEIGYLAGSQISKTESIFVLINYIIDREPGAMTLFFPNDNLAAFNASEKVIPALRSCVANSESIDKKLAEVSRKEKTLLIRFLGGFLRIAGAETSKNRKSVNSRVTFIDEASEIKIENIAEIIERSKTYAKYNRKLYLTSTIVHDDLDSSNLPIDPLLKFYHTAECVVHWEAKCRFCNTFQELKIENVKYPLLSEMPNKNENIYASWASRQSKYECEHCKKKWNDSDREYAINHGRKKIIRGDEETAISICLRISSLYSNFLPLQMIVSKMLEAEGNPSLEQKFYHGWLAKRYERVIEKTNPEQIFTTAINIDKGEVPNNTIALTLTVDVQKDHFWFMIAAQQDNKNIHIVDWGRVESWLNIEDMMESKIGASGTTIDLTGIDYGYSQDGTVLEFLLEHRGEAIPLKGGNNPDAKTYHTTDIESDGNGKPIKGGMKLYITNPHHYKSVTAAKLNRSYGESGTNIITIPKLEYLADGSPTKDFVDLAKQLTSENYFTDAEKSPNKKTGWQKITNHIDNHLWDCLYMQIFLRDLLKIDFIKPKAEKKEEVIPPPSILDTY